MIRIVTDSTSDITLERAKELNIDILALTVRFGDNIYKSGVEISNTQFFEKLTKEKELPSTAQVNPYEFEELFQKYVDAGDDVFCITISSELSGTYQSSVIAKENIGSDHIYLVDSRTTAYTLAVLVETAVILRDQGKTVQEIKEEIDTIKLKSRLYISIDTLEYLKKGGRISSSAALIGGIVGIHPMIMIENGLVTTAGKVRGNKARFQFFLDIFAEHQRDTRYPMSFAHALAEEEMNKLITMFKETYDVQDYFTLDIGPIIGTHSGPNVFGIGYIEK